LLNLFGFFTEGGIILFSVGEWPLRVKFHRATISLWKIKVSL